MKQTVIRSRQFLVEEGPTLGLLIAGSFLIRLALIFLWQTYHFPTERSMGIEMGFIAQNLATGEGFKIGDHYTAWMAPLYPYLLSLIFRLFGVYSITSAVVALLVQSLASALVEVPLYLIGKRLLGKSVGIVAGLLWAVHPASLLYAVSFIWSSSLTSLGLGVILLLFFRLASGPVARPERLAEAALCGMAIGLTALSDPVILPFVPVAGLWLLWRLKSRLTAAVAPLLLMAAVAGILLLPWTVRNYQIFHTFIPIKGTMGVNLWLGNHGPHVNQPTAGLDLWHKIPAVYGEEETAYLLSLNEAERDKVLGERARRFILDHPTMFANYTLWRIYLFWRMTDFGWSGLFMLPSYSLAAVGIFMSVRGHKFGRKADRQVPGSQVGVLAPSARVEFTSLLLLALLVLPIPYYLTIASTARFRFPLEQILILFAAYGSVILLRWLTLLSRRAKFLYGTQV